MSRSIWRLSASAASAAVSCVFSWADWALSIASSFFCCSKSAAFRSFRVLFGCCRGSAGVPGAALNLPPGPKTPFIRVSQSSVYAMSSPP